MSQWILCYIYKINAFIIIIHYYPARTVWGFCSWGNYTSWCLKLPKMGSGWREGTLGYHIPTQNLPLNPCTPLPPSRFIQWIHTLDLLNLICIAASLPWQIRKASWQWRYNPWQKCKLLLLVCNRKCNYCARQHHMYRLGLMHKTNM